MENKQKLNYVTLLSETLSEIYMKYTNEIYMHEEL